MLRLGSQTVKDIDLIIFDLDGTLIDSAKDIARSANYMMRSLGLDELDEKLIRGYIGDGARNLMRKCLGPERLHLADKALSIYLDRYNQHFLDYTVLYPGVEEVLSFYRNKKKAVVTNKPTDLSIAILRGLGVHGYFEVVLGGDSSKELKPSPEPVNRVLDSLGVSPERALIVGDSTIDIKTGRNAGVMTCVVTYGLGKSEELIEAGAELVINDISDLKRFFR